jgi:hypothetical protein
VAKGLGFLYALGLIAWRLWHRDSKLAPGLAGFPTLLFFPIVICWCQGRVTAIQLALCARE